MRLILTFTLTIGLAYSQQVSDETPVETDKIFTPPPKNTQYISSEYEEVTTTPSRGIGYISKYGEGKDKGAGICVPYYQCDGRQIVQAGVTDKRFEENECAHALEVCCKILEGGLDPKLPQKGEPIAPTTTETPVGPGPDITPKPAGGYCGIRNIDGIGFKIPLNYDNETNYGELPWMTALLKKNYDPTVDKVLAFCGGSLITPTVVLTGAHCVAKRKISEIKVRVGEWDTQTTLELYPHQERDVINIISHPNFNPAKVFNDVALLILDRPIDPAGNVGTLCLPPQNQIINSQNCFVAGWGKDVFGKAGRYQVILKKIRMSIIQPPQCEAALRTTHLGKKYTLDKSFICAGGEGGQDACTGDGGSPLMCPDPQNPKRYVQAGIVAWGIGCGQQGIPGVYADVAKFRSWIDGELQKLNIDTNPYIL